MKAILVESDSSVQNLVESHLRKVGFNDVEILQGDEKELTENLVEGDADLLILNWKNKKPSGSSLYKFIRGFGSTRSLPVILISGSITERDVHAIDGDARASFLIKPISYDVFRSVTGKLLGSKYEGKKAEKPSSGLYIERGEKRDSSLGLKIERGSQKGAENFTQMGEKRDHSTEYFEKDSDASGRDLRVDRGNKSSDSATTIERNDGPLTTAISGKASNDSEAAGKDLRHEKGHRSRSEMMIDSQESDQGRNLIHEKGHGSRSEMMVDSQQGSDSSRGLEVDKGPSIDTSKGLMIDPRQKSSGSTEVLDDDSPDEDRSILEKKEQGKGDFSYRENVESSEPSDLSAIFGQKSDGSIDLGSRTDLASFSEKDPYASIMKAMIIDKDESTQLLLDTYLGQKQVSLIEVCSSGDEAWEKIKEGDVDFVVMDWHLQEVSGLCLYNRIRSHPKMANIPVIVMSGFVSREDFRILEEGSMTASLQKPFQSELFEEVSESLLKKSIRDAKISNKVAELIDDAFDKKMPIKDFSKEILTTYPDSTPVLLRAAQFLYAKDRLTDAELLLDLANRLSPNNVVIFTQLAKIYHRTRRPDVGFDILRAAHAISPENIERLCLLGELGLSLQAPEEARNYFSDVLNIDSDHMKAKAGITLCDNMTDYLKEYGSQELISKQFASALNVVGVGLAQKDHVDKALAQYEAAMSFVGDSDNLSKLNFNMGLGYLRQKKMESAKNYFLKADELAKGKYPKATKYLKSLTKQMLAEDSELSSIVDDISEEEELFED